MNLKRSVFIGLGFSGAFLLYTAYNSYFYKGNIVESTSIRSPNGMLEPKGALGKPIPTETNTDNVIAQSNDDMTDKLSKINEQLAIIKKESELQKAKNDLEKLKKGIDPSEKESNKFGDATSSKPQYPSVSVKPPASNTGQTSVQPTSSFADMYNRNQYQGKDNNAANQQVAQVKYDELFDLKVKMILLTGERKSYLSHLGKNIVRTVGQDIAGWTVKDIGKDSITLKKDDSERTFYIEQQQTVFQPVQTTTNQSQQVYGK